MRLSDLYARAFCWSLRCCPAGGQLAQQERPREQLVDEGRGEERQEVGAGRGGKGRSGSRPPMRLCSTVPGGCTGIPGKRLGPFVTTLLGLPACVLPLPPSARLPTHQHIPCPASLPALVPVPPAGPSPS